MFFFRVNETRFKNLSTGAPALGLWRGRPHKIYRLVMVDHTTPNLIALATMVRMWRSRVWKFGRLGPQTGWVWSLETSPPVWHVIMY